MVQAVWWKLRACSSALTYKSRMSFLTVENRQYPIAAHIALHGDMAGKFKWKETMEGKKLSVSQCSLQVSQS